MRSSIVVSLGIFFLIQGTIVTQAMSGGNFQEKPDIEQSHLIQEEEQRVEEYNENHNIGPNSNDEIDPELNPGYGGGEADEVELNPGWGGREADEVELNPGHGGREVDEMRFEREFEERFSEPRDREDLRTPEDFEDR